MGLGISTNIRTEFEKYMVEMGLLPAIKPRREKVGRVDLRCIVCSGTGILHSKVEGALPSISCNVCGGTGVPKEGNAGYGRINSKTTKRRSRGKNRN